MSREITDTTNKYDSAALPEGKRIFMIASPVEKRYGKKGGEFFVWKLQYVGGIGDQILLPNMMGGLLRAIGCNEIEPNKFDWDTNEVEGKCFEATIKLVPDKNDPKIVRQHMSDFRKVEDNEIPF